MPIGSRQITSIVKRHSTGTNSTSNLLFFLLGKFLFFSSHNVLLLFHFLFALTKGFLVGLGNFGWCSWRTSLRRYHHGLVHGETETIGCSRLHGGRSFDRWNLCHGRAWLFRCRCSPRTQCCLSCRTRCALSCSRWTDSSSSSPTWTRCPLSWS